MNAEQKQLLRSVAVMIHQHPAEFSTESITNGIEGWTLLAARRERHHRIDTYTEAANLLGLTRQRADLLFLESRWPRRFRDRYVPEPSSPAEFQQNAKIAAARILHFVEAGA